MLSEDINRHVNSYIRDHLSPRPGEQAFIGRRYAELQSYLHDACFQSGSYARFTAIHPVHDLDVIFVLTDTSIMASSTNSQAVLETIAGNLRRLYTTNATSRVKISVQTHSITVAFLDSDDDFGVDIVPGIVAVGRANEYGDPMYHVPEIQKLAHRRREPRYQQATAGSPIGWVLSDPRGYIKAATQLNSQNEDFRHATKGIKGWRHGAKEAYGDDLELKAFHLEQFMSEYFSQNPTATTVDAIIDCLAELPQLLDRPRYRDRADQTKFIDDYVANLTQQQKQLILRLQSEALQIAQKLPTAATATEVAEVMAQLTTPRRARTAPPTTGPTVVTSTHKPWSSC